MLTCLVWLCGLQVVLAGLQFFLSLRNLQNIKKLNQTVVKHSDNAVKIGNTLIQNSFKAIPINRL